MNLIALLRILHAHTRQLAWAGLALLAVLVLVDAVPAWIDKEHAHTTAERLPGFWALFGFAACVVIIVLSKAFGHAGVMQREDYYDE